MDSFIELVPSKSKKGCDHYITYKKLNQVWIRIDNDNIKKAALSGLFKVNLAFYKNSETGTSVTYNIDFAQIKTYRGRKSVSFAKSLEVTENSPVNKGRKRKTSQKIPTKSSIQSDSTSHSELQDAVPSTSTSDQVQTTNPLDSHSELQDAVPSTSTSDQVQTTNPLDPHSELQDAVPSTSTSDQVQTTNPLDSQSAQSLIQGDSEADHDPKSNRTHLSTENQNTSSELTNDPANTQIDTPVIGEITIADPTENVGSQGPENITEPSTSTTKNDSSSDDTIIYTQNTSVEDTTQLKIISVRSLVADIPNQGTLEKSSGEVHCGMSAEHLAPLELSRRLHVNVEKYVNLLKRYQEGNVKVKPVREQDVRLTNIKEKKIPLEKFQEFYKDNAQKGSKPSGNSEDSKETSGTTPNPQDSDSSSEADDSEKDEEYQPDDDQEQLEIELALKASKRKRKPSKSEGNSSFAHSTT